MKGKNIYGKSFIDSEGKEFPLIYSNTFAIIKKIIEEDDCSQKQAWAKAYTTYGEEQIRLKGRKL